MSFPVMSEEHASGWLNAVAILGLLALWAPVPAAWIVGLRVCCGVAAYVLFVAHTWQEALATYDPNDPDEAPRRPAWLCEGL